MFCNNYHVVNDVVKRNIRCTFLLCRFSLIIFATGELLKVNKLTDRLRKEIVAAGYVEALSFILCSRDDCSTSMLLPEETIANKAVTISNPKTQEFQVCFRILYIFLNTCFRYFHYLIVAPIIFWSYLQALCKKMNLKVIYLKLWKLKLSLINLLNLVKLICKSNFVFKKKW